MSARRHERLAKQQNELQDNREELEDQLYRLKRQPDTDERKQKILETNQELLETNQELLETNQELLKEELELLNAATNSEEPEIQIQISNKNIELLELQIRSTTDPEVKNQLIGLLRDRENRLDRLTGAAAHPPPAAHEGQRRRSCDNKFARGRDTASSLSEKQAQEFAFPSGPSQHHLFLDFLRQQKDNSVHVPENKLQLYNQFMDRLVWTNERLQKHQLEGSQILGYPEKSDNEAIFKSLYALELSRLLTAAERHLFAVREFPTKVFSGNPSAIDVAVIYCPPDDPFLSGGKFVTMDEFKKVWVPKDSAQHTGYLGDQQELGMLRGKYQPMFGTLIDKHNIRLRAWVPVYEAEDRGEFHLATCELGMIAIGQGANVGKAAKDFYLFIQTALKAMDELLDNPLDHSRPVPQIDSRLGCNSVLYDSNRVVKTFDYAGSQRDRAHRRRPNLELYSEAWGESESSDVWVEELTEDVSLLHYTYRTGTHKPFTIGQFGVLCEQVGRLHGKGWVHGDIRARNVVFSEDGVSTWLIDFDFAAKCGERYPPTFAHEDLPFRHEDARASEPRQYMHDRHALNYLLLHWFEGEGLTEISDKLTGNDTLEDIAQIVCSINVTTTSHDLQEYDSPATP